MGAFVQPNPYTPSGRPRVFVGREQERTRLRDRLARVAAYGEMMGPLTVVTGPRGLGKTSLLRDVADQATEDGFVVAWVFGVKQQPFLADVVDEVTRSLRRADVLDPKQRASKRVEEVGVEVNAGIAKVSATIGLNHGDQAAGQTALGGPLQDFMRHSSNLVRDRGGAGLLVVIDELHAPLESRFHRDYSPTPQAAVDAAVLLNVVQNMDAEREQFPIGILGAGLPQTKPLLTRAATFGERSHEVVLREFDHATAQAVLTEPAQRLDVTWSADALTVATDDAGGYPQALQIIGSAAWEAARPEPGDHITRSHIEEAREVAAADMASLFETRWAVASDAEKQFLRAMSHHSETAVPRGAIAANLGVDSNAVGMARRSLINKGIIEAPAHGRLRFTIPGFGEFVRSQYGDPAPPPAAHEASFPIAARHATSQSIDDATPQRRTARDAGLGPDQER